MTAQQSFFVKLCQNSFFSLQVLSISSIELRKRKPRFDSNFLKIENKI